MISGYRGIYNPSRQRAERIEFNFDLQKLIAHIEHCLCVVESYPTKSVFVGGFGFIYNVFSVFVGSDRFAVLIDSGLFHKEYLDSERVNVFALSNFTVEKFLSRNVEVRSRKSDLAFFVYAVSFAVDFYGIFAFEAFFKGGNGKFYFCRAFGENDFGFFFDDYVFFGFELYRTISRACGELGFTRSERGDLSFLVHACYSRVVDGELNYVISRVHARKARAEFRSFAESDIAVTYNGKNGTIFSFFVYRNVKLRSRAARFRLCGNSCRARFQSGYAASAKIKNGRVLGSERYRRFVRRRSRNSHGFPFVHSETFSARESNRYFSRTRRRGRFTRRAVLRIRRAAARGERKAKRQNDRYDRNKVSDVFFHICLHIFFTAGGIYIFPPVSVLSFLLYPLVTIAGSLYFAK